MDNNNKKKNIPIHVGIIIDGNRRWARERNLPTFEGHARGYERLKECLDWFFLRGVKIVSGYMFSTENWKRDRKEVDYLMNLAAERIKEDLAELHKKDYKIIHSGRLEELPGDLPELFDNAIIKTKNNTSGTFNMCFNYGGRPELMDAIRKIIRNQLTEEQIYEGIIKKYLYHGELPDPDVIVRTSGEQRLSNFLTWQSAYAELMFIKKYWPDFEEQDVVNIIAEFNNRERRLGGN